MTEKLQLISIIIQTISLAVISVGLGLNIAGGRRSAAKKPSRKREDMRQHTDDGAGVR